MAPACGFRGACAEPGGWDLPPQPPAKGSSLWINPENGSRVRVRAARARAAGHPRAPLPRLMAHKRTETAGDELCPSLSSDTGQNVSSPGHPATRVCPRGRALAELALSPNLRGPQQKPDIGRRDGETEAGDSGSGAGKGAGRGSAVRDPDVRPGSWSRPSRGRRRLGAQQGCGRQRRGPARRPPVLSRVSAT